MAKIADAPADEVRSFSEMAREQNLPVLTSRKAIAEMGTVTWLSAEPSEARNPQSGLIEPGLLVQLEDSDGNRWQTYVGNVALLDVMASANYAEDGETVRSYVPYTKRFPFKARLIKSGQTWTFAD